MIRKERKACWTYRCVQCDWTSPASVDLFGAQEWQQLHRRVAGLAHAWQELAAGFQPVIDFVTSIIGTVGQQTQTDFALVQMPVVETRFELRACAETVWDGPYKMKCGYVIVNGKCVRHGPGGPTYIVPPESPTYDAVRKARQDG